MLVPDAAEVTLVAAEVTLVAAEVTLVAAEVTLVAAEVTVAVTDVTGAAAEVLEPEEVLEPDPVLAAAEVTEPELVLVPVTAEVTEPMANVTEPVAEVTGPVAALVVAAVAAEVTGLVADVAAEVAEVTAEVAEVTGNVVEVTGNVVEVVEPVLVPHAALVLVPVTGEASVPVTGEASVPVSEAGQGLLGGAVAADAWRENASKASMIPAATIATCTARRAACRKIGSGMSSSRTTGTGQTWLCVPIISGLKRGGVPIFQPIFAVVTRSRTFAVRPQMYILSGHHRTEKARAGQGLDG